MACEGTAIAPVGPQLSIDAALARDESRPRRWCVLRFPRSRA
jgi:hypothetical protein